MIGLVAGAGAMTVDGEGSDRSSDAATSGDRTSEVAEADADSVVRTSLISPPDEDGFINGVMLREAAAVEQLDRATLIDFGLRSCALRDEYVMGDRPSPTDLLAGDLADEIGGLDPDDVASAVANAAHGRPCEVTVEGAG